MKQAYLARHLISLIQGKYDEVNLNYVKENMRCEGGARYVEYRWSSFLQVMRYSIVI